MYFISVSYNQDINNKEENIIKLNNMMKYM